MFRVHILAFFALLTLHEGACTPQTVKSGSAVNSANSVQSKPDKSSEEPIGLPGYPLICDWLLVPSTDSLKGQAECFLSDAQGERASLPTLPAWKVTYSGPATLTSELVNEGIVITVTGSSFSQVEEAFQDMVVHVAVDGAEVATQGRDAFKPGPGQWRFAGSCQTSFMWVIMGDSGGFVNMGAQRFDGCEVLASALTKVTVPNPSYRVLPDLHKAVQGTCKNDTFSLNMTQNKNVMIYTLGVDACLDLSAFVNSLGI